MLPVQIEKWQSAAFEQMYGFCPLDLYSGDWARMMVALGELKIKGRICTQ